MIILKTREMTIKNKKASFDYEFIQKFTAGIVLKGTEVKSLRRGKASIKESFCFFNGNELFIKSMHISEHDVGELHGAERDRKLLLTKKELKSLKEKIATKGLTIVPISVYFNDKNFVKVEIALARGKREYDKKNAIRERDIDRDTKNSI